MTTLRLGVLASGRGSNLQALLDAEADRTMAAVVAVVLSDREDTAAIRKAEVRGIPALTIDPQSRRARLQPAVEARYVEALRSHGVDWVVLAGFFRIVGAPLLQAFPDRVLNIHPSLLPAFPGLDAQGQALAHGVRVAGCTVHLVDAEVDAGAILTQAAVAVKDEDSLETLAARILEQEHRILVETVHRIAIRGFVRSGRRIRWNLDPAS